MNDEVEKDAIEKLKNAEWSPTNEDRQDGGYTNTGYSVEGDVHRNVLHQRRGDSLPSTSNKNGRSISQKVNKRKQQK